MRNKVFYEVLRAANSRYRLSSCLCMCCDAFFSAEETGDKVLQDDEEQKNDHSRRKDLLRTAIVQLVVPLHLPCKFS